MARKLPLQSELKPVRCHAWEQEVHQSGMIMSELAHSITELLGRGDESKLVKQLSNYQRSKPSLPALDVCVAVESLLGRAKGQIYQAIAQTERVLHEGLQKQFGELPLQYDPEHKTFYAQNDAPMPEAGDTITHEQFATILRVRRIPSTALGAAIGRPGLHWQRLATFKRLGEQGKKDPLPLDIAQDVIAGFKKLAAAGPAASGSAPEKTPRAARPQERKEREASKQITAEEKETPLKGDDLRIVGLGGLNISVPIRLNFQDFRLEDESGNVLIQEKKLRIPPIPLTDLDREQIRRWIAEIVAKKMV